MVERREVRPRSDLTLLTEEGRNRVCRGGVEGEVMQQIMSLLVLRVERSSFSL